MIRADPHSKAGSHTGRDRQTAVASVGVPRSTTIVPPRNTHTQRAGAEAWAPSPFALVLEHGGPRPAGGLALPQDLRPPSPGSTPPCRPRARCPARPSRVRRRAPADQARAPGRVARSRPAEAVIEEVLQHLSVPGRHGQGQRALLDQRIGLACRKRPEQSAERIHAVQIG
jgi:hypothetical protein